MSNQKEFLVQQEMVKEYFKNISEANVDTLDQYLKTLLVKQLQADPDAPKTIGELLSNIKEGNNKTAIHFAASRGDLQIFKYLISVGADYKARDEQDLQNSPFLVAVEHQRKEIVTYLLDELHQDVNEQRNTVTALHQASQAGDIPLVELLISHGADINADSHYGTPLMYAAANQRNWLCESFMRRGADPNKKSKVMPPFLHLVVDQNNQEMFDVCIAEFKDKLDFNILDGAGWSVVQLCAERGRTEMLKQIIQCGGDVDYENEGQSSLDVAVQHAQWDCVEVLRQRARRAEPIHKVEVQVVELTQPEKEDLLKRCLEIKAKGNQLFATKNYAEAIECYVQIIEMSKQIHVEYAQQFAPIYTNLASCYLPLQQPKKALEVCERARNLNPKWIKTYILEGKAYEQLLDFGEAAVSYFDALKLEHNQMYKDLFDQAIKQGREQHKQNLQSK